jgi:single-strand DNA-binding protein
MNKTVLIGRLTKDPETRYTQTNNIQVTSFTLAVNRRFSKEGEQQADFINIVAWNKTAEFVSKYFKKGQQVAIVGRIQTRNYDDNNGVKHYVTEVIAEEVYFADSKKEGQVDASNLGNSTPVTNNDFEITSSDDLPF